MPEQTYTPLPEGGYRHDLCGWVTKGWDECTTDVELRQVVDEMAAHKCPPPGTSEVTDGR